jgi:hypothetical protein
MSAAPPFVLDKRLYEAKKQNYFDLYQRGPATKVWDCSWTKPERNFAAVRHPAPARKGLIFRNARSALLN